MKKSVIIGIILIIILVVGGIYFLKPSASKTLGSNSPSSSPPVNSRTIDIVGFAFSPATLTINKGDTIVWTNKDTMAHTVTSDSGNELASENLVKGQTYSHTFNTIGSFDYHCNIHTSMKGTIIVK